MELISRAALLGIIVLAGVLLFTPYEAFLEGTLAFLIVVAVMGGSFMHPKKEVFYVRTAVPRIDPERNQAIEHDLLAVQVELARLGLLFVPTALATAFLVFFAAGGPAKFSVLNWVLSSKYAFIGFYVCELLPLPVLILVSAWVSERKIMRDAEACAARSFTFPTLRSHQIGRVSYLFMGEHGEYYGGNCMYFGSEHPPELANIVFHNPRKPEINRIAMGLLFHRLIVLGRGVTDLDTETVAAQTALAGTASGL